VVGAPGDDLGPAVRPLPSVAVLVVLIQFLLPRGIGATHLPAEGIGAELIGLPDRIPHPGEEERVIGERRGIGERANDAHPAIEHVILDRGDVARAASSSWPRGHRRRRYRPCAARPPAWSPGSAIRCRRSTSCPGAPPDPRP